MACMSRLATAILSGQTELALGIIRVIPLQCFSLNRSVFFNVYIILTLIVPSANSVAPLKIAASRSANTQH